VLDRKDRRMSPEQIEQIQKGKTENVSRTRERENETKVIRKVVVLLWVRKPQSCRHSV